jgi:hypothetical protein
MCVIVEQRETTQKYFRVKIIFMVFKYKIYKYFYLNPLFLYSSIPLKCFEQRERNNENLKVR